VIDFVAHETASVVIIGGCTDTIEDLYIHDNIPGKEKQSVEGLVHAFKKNKKW